MSRIEISIDLYNKLIEKNKKLETALFDVSKEAAEYKERLANIEGLVIDLENVGLRSRLFAWKKVINPLLSIFKKNGK